MCGRYYVNEEAWARMREDFSELPEANPFMHFGDVTPAMPAVSLTAAGVTEAGLQAALDMKKKKVTR